MYSIIWKVSRYCFGARKRQFRPTTHLRYRAEILGVFPKFSIYKREHRLHKISQAGNGVAYKGVYIP